MNVNDYISIVGDKILVREHDFDKETSDGLSFLKREDKRTIGTVIAVKENSDSNICLDDKVVYPKFAGVNVEIKGEKFKMLEHREIFFIYNDDVIKSTNRFLVIKPYKKNSDSELSSVKADEDDNTSGHIIALPDDLVDKHILKEGDRVVFSKYSGFPASIKGHNFIILSEEEIFFTIKEQ